MARFMIRPPTLLVTAAFATGLVARAALAQDDDVLDLPADEAATPAEARKVGVVPFLPVGNADLALAEAVTRKISAELASDTLSVVSVPLASSSAKAKRAQATAADAAEAEVKKGKERVQQGRALIDKLNFGRATQSFQRALRSFEAGASALVDIDAVYEAWLGLSEVYARRGESEKQAEALSQAIRLDPERELDPSRFPAMFIRSHAELRSELMKEGTAALFIDATGAEGEVRLDGRVLGTAPLRVRGLLPGRHYVRVFREGRGVFGAVVEVAAGDELTLSPGFTRQEASGAADLLADNQLTAEAVAEIGQAGRKAGVDVVLLGVVGRSDFAVPTAIVALDLRSGASLRVRPMQFDGDLLNLSIELLQVKEAIERVSAGAGDAAPSWDEPLLPRVRTSAELEVSEVQLRFRVKPVAAVAGRGARVIGAEPESAVTEARRRLSGGGETGARRKSLRDDDDPFAEAAPRSRRAELVQEDIPLTEQPWFWPAAVGGGVVGATLLVGGTAWGLVAAGILADPRPSGGFAVTVDVP